MTSIPHNSNTQRRIKPLPPLLVNQLAAGEIVTRPASVVKELVENAIDAGATHIEIKVTQGGMGMIEVRDDGFGIHPDDMIMAVTRHATSKIADVANLQGIKTLGFRGEALASMAAVSRLSLTSCHDDSGIGRELSVAGVIDDVPILSPVIHSQGTTVIVKDLYFNVPARRGNLKSIATEFAHIEAVVQGLALAVSHADITLWHNNKKRFSFAAIASAFQKDLYSPSDYPVHSHQIMKRLGDIIAIKPSQDCVKPLQVDLSALINGQNLEELNPSTADTANINSIQDIGINGLLFITPITSYVDENSNSSSLSGNDQPKLIYINGRLVKDNRITHHIKEAVNQINTSDSDNQARISNLGYVLFFTLPLSWLNVNVHPSKQRIGIEHLPNILAHLKVNLVAALRGWQREYQPPQHDPLISAASLDSNTLTKSDHPLTPTSSTWDGNHKVSESLNTYRTNSTNLVSSQSDVNQAECLSDLKSNLHLPPRCVALVVNNKDNVQRVDTLNRGMNDDSCPLKYKTFVMAQDGEGICIIELPAIIQLIQSLVESQPLSDAPLAEHTKTKLKTDQIEQLIHEDNSKVLAILNDYLEQWYGQDNKAAKNWQQFNKKNSINNLNHHQLLNMLIP